MKKHMIQLISFLLVLTFATVIPAMEQDKMDHSKMVHEMTGEGEEAVHDAMDHSKMGHEMTEKVEDAAHDAMDHDKMHHDMAGKENGKNWIRKAHIQSHYLAYELIDMREKMKDMPEMKNTHHLMVFIKDAQGNTLGKAKVGYMIEGPGEINQKTMAMGMGGGFGADVNLGVPGTYIIKAKVKADKTKLMDSFEYEIK